jgi:hypothetical protein
MEREAGLGVGGQLGELNSCRASAQGTRCPRNLDVQVYGPSGRWSRSLSNARRGPDRPVATGGFGHWVRGVGDRGVVAVENLRPCQGPVCLWAGPGDHWSAAAVSPRAASVAVSECMIRFCAEGDPCVISACLAARPPG